MKKKYLHLGVAVVASAITTHAFSGNWNVPIKSRDLVNTVEMTKETLAEGAKIYTKHCTKCHDEQGRGIGEHIDYTLQSILKIPSQPGNKPLSDGELYWKITHGIGRMPAYAGILTDYERWLMVNHIRALPEDVE